MNKTGKRIIYFLIAFLLILQFVPMQKNLGQAFRPDHYLQVISASEEVQQVLKTSCFDCHSHATEYPWYASVQPLGFWLNHHVNEGKEELNFSEFAGYKLKRQLHKLEEIVEMVEEGEMPLASYTFIHGNAKLDEAQKQLLISWAKSSRTLLKSAGSSAAEKEASNSDKQESGELEEHH